MRSIATLKIMFPPIHKVNSSTIPSFSDTRITCKYQMLIIETFTPYMSTRYVSKVNSMIISEMKSSILNFKSGICNNDALCRCQVILQ